MSQDLTERDFYQIKPKMGRPVAIQNPEELRVKANQYFQWCIDHPLKEEQVVKYKEHYEKATVNKPRVFTINGLCMFIGIGLSTFYDYEQKPEFTEIITHIRNVIYHQKFEGASAGFFKENIIIRDLKLRETSEVQHLNAPRELTAGEIKALNETLSDRYGEIPEPLTIDIEHEEIE